MEHRSDVRLDGRVTEVWAQEGYGRVAAGDETFCFLRDDVADGGFASLLVGAEVSFERGAPIEGEPADGEPHALRVRVERPADVSFPD